MLRGHPTDRNIVFTGEDYEVLIMDTSVPEHSVTAWAGYTYLVPFFFIVSFFGTFIFLHALICF
jgi:hypothetical protein